MLRLPRKSRRPGPNTLEWRKPKPSAARRRHPQIHRCGAIRRRPKIDLRVATNRREPIRWRERVHRPNEIHWRITSGISGFTALTTRRRWTVRGCFSVGAGVSVEEQAAEYIVTKIP